MSALEIGKKLVELCRAGNNIESVNSLYHSDVESIEAIAPQGGERLAKGIDAVRGKNQWWLDNHEIHDSSVEGPYPHGDDRFAVRFQFDVTNKPSGQRIQMDEVGLFTLKDNKVIREEFFYDFG